jgi:hypothetical protein
MPPDDRYPSPRTFLRHAIGLDVSAPASLSPPADLDGAGDLPAVYALRDELRAAQARVKHLEAALRAAGRVLQPYLAGNGR